MATSLIPALDTSLQRQAMAYQADLLQNLGAQVRRDVTTVMTNRQMKGLAEGLQSVDTTSPQFGRQISGILAQYPLAAQSPLGQAAINQLGSEFKLNQQIAAEDRRFRNQLGAVAARDFVNNAPYGTTVTAQGLYNVATGGQPSGASSASSAGPSTPFQEPPLPEGGLPTQGAPDLFGAGSPAPGIPAAQPQIIPGVANPNAGQPAAAPVNNVGAQIQQYDQQLRQSGVPRHLAEGMMRSYAQSLTAQQRPGSRRVESTDKGLMSIGPDGVARPVTTEDGTPVSRATGNLANTEADNRRADASMRLREAGDLQSQANRIQKQMDQTGIGAPGPFQENGKWYKNTETGKKEVNATVAQRWLDLNHEFTQLQQNAQQATQAYQSLTTPPAATAAPSAPVRMRYVGGQLITQ